MDIEYDMKFYGQPAATLMMSQRVLITTDEFNPNLKFSAPNYPKFIKMNQILWYNKVTTRVIDVQMSIYI